MYITTTVQTFPDIEAYQTLCDWISDHPSFGVKKAWLPLDTSKVWNEVDCTLTTIMKFANIDAFIEFDNANLEKRSLQIAKRNDLGITTVTTNSEE